MLRRVVAVIVAAVALPAATAAQAAPPAKPAAERVFPDLGLTLRLPPELQLVVGPAPTEPAVRETWNGKFGASELRLSFISFSRGGYYDEPSQVIDLFAYGMAAGASGGDAVHQFDEVTHLDGPFGEASYATWARSIEIGDAGSSQVLRLSGLLPESCYILECRPQPALEAEDATAVRDLLAQSIVYDGPQRDPKWTDEEAEARWRSDAPDAVHADLEILRSPHYIILTNSSGGKSFAKKMEECYAEIRKVYAFDEVPGRRLMPVYLFRTNDQYYEFFPKTLGLTVEDGKRTGGIASRDFYATWYEAPGDPVHIHEATHQIFRNRLGLGGAGSWFQEGVAEYMSSKDNERGDAARAVKKGRAMPLAEFVRVESLLFSADAEDKSGKDEAGNQYKLAALFVEFVRESKFGKAKFNEYIRAVGRAPRNDGLAIEAAVQRVYGVDLAGLEREFVEYCKKR